MFLDRYFVKNRKFETIMNNFEKYDFFKVSFFNIPSYSKLYADSNAKTVFIWNHILSYSVFAISGKNNFNGKIFVMVFNIFLILLIFTFTFGEVTVRHSNRRRTKILLFNIFLFKVIKIKLNPPNNKMGSRWIPCCVFFCYICFNILCYGVNNLANNMKQSQLYYRTNPKYTENDIEFWPKNGKS